MVLTQRFFDGCATDSFAAAAAAAGVVLLAVVALVQLNLCLAPCRQAWLQKQRRHHPLRFKEASKATTTPLVPA
jgi:hypothetical protein